MDDVRLIDANALKKKQFGAFGWLAGKDLAAAPTIDAVPVVRCKDCKWSAYRKSPFGVQTFTCQLLCADIKPDDFCSYGERKDGEG